MATILVAMFGYAILFGALSFIPEVSTYLMGLLGLFFAVVAVAQAVFINLGNPRGASIFAGGMFWFLFAVIQVMDDNFPLSSCTLLAALSIAAVFGPIAGYLAGTLVGGAFLISHYLRESRLLRRRGTHTETEADSPWDPLPEPPSPLYEKPPFVPTPRRSDREVEDSYVIHAPEAAHRRIECTIPVLPVRNLPRSIAFYTGVLGFQLDWGGSPGEKVCSVSRDNCRIMLMQEEQMTRPAWVWIGLENDYMFDEYRANGVRVVQEPRNYSWAYEMKFADIDGNILWVGTETKTDVPVLDADMS
jgi:predicted lactoylglutathione lyase